MTRFRMSRMTLATLLALVPAIAQAATPATYDVIVRNGMIYDGNGAAPFAGDIAVKGDRIAPDVAAFVGAGTVRSNLLDERDVQPDAAQLTAMRVLARQAMEEGAVGLTTALMYSPDTSAVWPTTMAARQADRPAVSCAAALGKAPAAADAGRKRRTGPGRIEADRHRANSARVPI